MYTVTFKGSAVPSDSSSSGYGGGVVIALPGFAFDSSSLHSPPDDTSVPIVPSSSSSFFLPPCMWYRLALLLPLRDLARCAQVSRSWRTSIASFSRAATLPSTDSPRLHPLSLLCPNLQQLVFPDPAAASLCTASEFSQFPHLTELFVRPGPLAGRSAPCLDLYPIIPHLPSTLRSLSLPMCRFTRGSLRMLEKLTSLTHLDLSYGDWRADDWNWSPLINDPVSDDWIDHFPEGLTYLNLSHCFILSDRVLKRFVRFPKLAVLNVENCFQLTDVGIASLPHCVQDLDLTQCIGVFRKGEARSGVLPADLQRLRLSFNFNDHFIAYIPSSITCLLLEKSYITDEGMKTLLSMLKNLQELSCAACINIGDATLAELPMTLRKLDLWFNRNITDAGLLSLKSPIEVLDITNCNKLTCEGIKKALDGRPLQVVAVGTLFVPDNMLRRVAIVREQQGIYSHRPRLFIDVVTSTTAASYIQNSASASKLSDLSKK